MRNTWPQKRATSTFNDNSGKFRHILVIISLLHSAVYYGRRLKLPPQITIITINVVHEVQNKYKHKRKEKKQQNRKAKKNMTVTTSLYAQMFYGRTDVIFTNSTVR